MLQSLLRTTRQKTELLKTLGIRNASDLLLYFPFRYDDRSQIKPLSQFQTNETGTSKGTLSAIKNQITKNGILIQKATFTDKEGVLVECVWFRQPHLAMQWNFFQEVLISGKLQYKKKQFSFISPVLEKWSGKPIHAGTIVPIYHETKGITSKWLREKIQKVLPMADQFPDILPEFVRNEFKFPKKSEAIKTIHFPKTAELLNQSRTMLGFEELYVLQLGALQQKRKWSAQGGAIAMPINPELMKSFQQQLPFQLTNSQKIALYQILKDCEKTSPMLRLLEGDVGSGKTVVAAMAMLPYLKARYQCVVMAPTEILAEQHFSTLRKVIHDIPIQLLTGSVSPSEKKRIRKEIAEGRVLLTVGTHALIQETIKIPKLAFAVIDEQHRFGVVQRSALVKKSSGIIPHLLMMSATPIPRTLALTIFGDQELTIIAEMPPGRKPVITKLVPPGMRKKANLFIDQKIEKGEQAFVICPLIEESEKLEVKSVLQEYERLRKEDFPHRRIAYLHGKMESPEKDEVMKKFKNRELDMLVSTSVVEVGIDIPNATIMVIEGSERFGLSQLHQFRGRVGRSERQSYCFLYTSKKEQQSGRRLKAMIDHTDGFKLAEIDLSIRGPGEVYGIRQSGLPDLKIASLMDAKTIALAREKAKELLEQDPDLNRFPLLKNLVEQNYAHPF